MIAEKIIFNILAISIFIYILLNVIRKNDTRYFVLLIMQAIGMLLNFLEVIFFIFTGITSKILMYLLSVILPMVVIYTEKNNISFLEFANIILARICILLRNNKQAKIFLIDTIQKYEKNYDAHRLLAEIYEKEGGMRKAIDEYVIAIDLRKNDYDSYYKIGKLLYQLDKKDEAMTVLNNLLKVKPEHIEASRLVADILCSKGEFKEAINIYTSLLKYETADYQLYYNLGMAYARLNDFQNAKIYYEKAIDANTALYNGYYSLGQISLMYNDIAKAEEYFNKSLDGSINAKVYFQLAKISIKKGDNGNGATLLSNAIAIDSDIINKVDEELIFMPVRKDIITWEDNEDNKKEHDKIAEKYINENEKETIKHLEDTVEIIERMDVKGSENS